MAMKKREADFETLARFAARCRQTLEWYSPTASRHFSDFPYQCCTYSAMLVGRLLKERFDLDGCYVGAGEHPELSRQQEHGWYEANGYIFDITYDQFEGTGLSGWVFPCGSSRWHDAFAKREIEQGFCTPDNLWMYPVNEYKAMRRALIRCKPSAQPRLRRTTM